MNSYLNITSALTGLSKALTVANQAIPLYKQVSPMIKNAKNAYSSIKDFGKKTNRLITKNTTNYQSTPPQKKEVVYNNPIFFQ